ncbi:hypothetical protein A3K93_10195 [Acinetobacter sp. NCu2D-2]|uniref:DUF6670 family protein n=1 Tax=Acinetobacter sp. NCu2D-2 TaxID=1608473 RepID=UPI0007CDAC63|nr:DUF6670 family protein [Acinetobacter sp. NCu2D-2]ANF82522.1 hypothetical protein A3K93_10195 [Acinetobacter sp. NCu2D-2]
MRFFQRLFDRKRDPQTSEAALKLAYHPPNNKYKIVHQALILPNLATPLRYFNFYSLMGQPSLPIFQNQQLNREQVLDCVTVMSSVSPHMQHHLHTYSLQQECHLQQGNFDFSQREILSGDFPIFELKRDDDELSCDLKIFTTQYMSYFKKMQLGLFEHWSVLVKCEGHLKYQNKIYDISSLGSFEYARSVDLPALPIAYMVYMVMNISGDRQLLCMQLRDLFNRVVQSKMYLRDLVQNESLSFEQNVYFKVHRVFPQVTNSYGRTMYLPREFEWQYQDKDLNIEISGNCIGDYKFGYGAGYVGSFDFNLKINGVLENGAGGYVQYVDCRNLKFQELDDLNKNPKYFAEVAVLIRKKH